MKLNSLLMCGSVSWQVTDLQVLARPEFTLLLQPTGLFAEEGAFLMDEGFAAHAWAADQRIAQLSGQPFSESYRTKVLGDKTSIVDSGPATLALTAVHPTAPDREFATLKAIQAARYVEGQDNGKAEVIAQVLKALDLPRGQFEPAVWRYRGTARSTSRRVAP
jgi:putative protein-disulfide isomerase